jgi:hypothetical protein
LGGVEIVQQLFFELNIKLDEKKWSFQKGLITEGNLL